LIRGQETYQMNTFKFLVTVLFIVAVLTGCATPPTVQVEVVTVEVPVMQTVISVQTAAPGELPPITVVAPTSVPTSVPELTPTPDAIRITVGNEQTPSLDQQNCYSRVLNYETSKQTAVPVGTELAILGRSNPTRGEWVAVTYEDEVCWLHDSQITFVGEVNWDTIPIYP
jgi:hypothetical protein